MTQEGIDNLGDLDELLATLNLMKFNASVVEPDGTAHGWMTTTRNVNPDGSESLWFGLKRLENLFKFEASEHPSFDFFDGDQQMYSFESVKEITAFMRGILWAMSTG